MDALSPSDALSLGAERAAAIFGWEEREAEAVLFSLEGEEGPSTSTSAAGPATTSSSIACSEIVLERFCWTVFLPSEPELSELLLSFFRSWRLVFLLLGLKEPQPCLATLFGIFEDFKVGKTISFYEKSVS